MEHLDHLGIDDDVIFAGIDFLRELTSAYGAERGQQFFDALGTAMGEDVKSAVFLALLTGDALGSTVSFSVTNTATANVNAMYGSSYPKVAAIKALRAATGLGLKDAKDRIEASENTPQKVKCHSHQHAKDLRVALRDVGFVIGNC